MKVIRIIFMVALVIALALTSITLIATKNTIDQNPKKDTSDPPKKIQMPSKRLSRFLAENPRIINPRAAADHCNKDNDICVGSIMEGRNATCCNNKCVDLDYDAYNCGACKKICLPFEACCNGKCVNLSYDKRHCGVCNKKCMPGGYCIYGICDYA